MSKTPADDYVLVEWVEDSTLSVERAKQVHTIGKPRTGTVYPVEFKHATGKVIVYQGKIIAIGDKKTLQNQVEEVVEPSQPELPAKRQRKMPKHLQSFTTSAGNKNLRPSSSSPKKGTKSKSTSLSLELARGTLEDDFIVEDLPDSEDMFSSEDADPLLVMDLKNQIKTLETENKTLKQQLDLQDTVKQLKKVVKRLSSQTHLDTSEHGNTSKEQIEDVTLVEVPEKDYEHLRYRPSDSGVIEIVKGTQVYLPKSEFMAAMTAKTDTTMARNLLCRIFHHKALLECSVRGNVSKGKGKTSIQKPPLNPRAINAIITCVLHKFKRTLDRAPALVTAMGTRLSELRSDHKGKVVQSSHAQSVDEDETQLDIHELLPIAADDGDEDNSTVQENEDNTVTVTAD